MIRVDNAPEFIRRKLDLWCHENKIPLAFKTVDEVKEKRIIG